MISKIRLLKDKILLNFFSLDKYVTELMTLAATCNFGVITDSLIRDRVVCGTLRLKLFRQRAKVTETKTSATLHVYKEETHRKRRALMGMGQHTIQILWLET